jgi:hypothetical protein
MNAKSKGCVQGMQPLVRSVGFQELLLVEFPNLNFLPSVAISSTHKCMEAHINRGKFIQKTIAGAVGLFLPVNVLKAQGQQPEKPAPIKIEIVKEFVGASHGKFDRVKEMLGNDHLLLHVSHDWGGGDYESGIEAAGHMGNKEIARYLLDKGARYNVYVACMLGHLDIVKQVLASHQQLLNSKRATWLYHAASCDQRWRRVKGGSGLPSLSWCQRDQS